MMGPICRKRARTTRNSSSRRRTISKNQIRKSKNQEKADDVSAANSPVLKYPISLPEEGSRDLVGEVEASSITACSTPKAAKFRIPEIKTCPRAPKKRRVITSCSLRRTSITFFTPPDIELFFNLALHGIPV